MDWLRREKALASRSRRRRIVERRCGASAAESPVTRLRRPSLRKRSYIGWTNLLNESLEACAISLFHFERSIDDLYVNET